MKYILALMLLSTVAHAITAPETISSEKSEEIEVGAPKDCVVLGKSNASDDSDKHALQKQVMDCLGPQEDVAPVEIQKKTQVVSQ